ncbi:hypothetical protein K439DRAFT_1627008, partial [Ramaria rubella]
MFLGRNWNAGETVELVLRDARDRFHSTSRMLGVFCHELAHIKHMDHSSAFHSLRRQLSAEVAELRRKGYYGDGYWSAGTRLSDSKRVSGGWADQELPEYTCGGAHSQSRNLALPSRRRRRARRPAGPSLTTGAQTQKQRKAGSRVTSKYAFDDAGGGSVLDRNVEKGDKGSGFGKRAGSRRAREERALAAERRLMQSQGKSSPEQPQPEHSESEVSGAEDDSTNFERVALETDKERLKWMRDVIGEEDMGALRDDDDDDLIIGSDGVIETGVPSAQTLGTSSRSSLPFSKSRDNSHDNKHGTDPIERQEGPSKKRKTDDTRVIPDIFKAPSGSASVSGRMVDQEMQQRKKEALGMDRPRRLGERVQSVDKPSEWACHVCTFANPAGNKECSMCEEPRRQVLTDTVVGWTCPACTFENNSGAKICEMCDRARP